MRAISRRGFIKSVALLAAGTAVGAPNVSGTALASPEIEVPPLPWPYAELDVEYVRKLGHLGYYKGRCAAGAFYAIIRALREKVGFPYTLLPIEPEGEHGVMMMAYGAGGMVGWASVCGALNGAAAAINLVSKNYKKIIHELLGWYTEFPFPSDESNEYARKHEFLVEKLKTDKVLPKSVCGSINCHESVTKWCLASGYASGSAERSERCARLTGDVAAKAVELLNAELKGTFTSMFKFTAETAECRTCHYKGKDYEMGQFTRGKMACELCHKDMRPHAGKMTLRTAFGIPLETWGGAFAGASIIGGILHFARKLAGRGKSSE